MSVQDRTAEAAVSTWAVPTSEVRGPAPASFRPLVHPLIHRLVPEPRILRFQYPVAYVGEVEHLRRHAHDLQRGEELEAFAHVEPVVALAMDDQRRRLEILRRVARRPLVVHVMIRVRRALELPVVEPELFRRAPRRKWVEH